MVLIASGINYVGNKFRMLPTLLDNLDTSRTKFLDVFCGGGTVGANVLDLYDEVIMNDGCWQLVGVLNAIQNDDNFLQNVENVINAYGLGKYNKEAYIECRRDYNEKFSKEDTFNPYILYALMCHSFSYNVVFNKNGGFSVPSGVGKSWFNPTLKGKLLAFQHVLQEHLAVPFYNMKFQHFFDTIIETYSEDEYKTLMVYCDPPYSAKCADGSVSRSYGLKWTVKEDKELIAYLDNFNDIGIHWCLSNVFENKGQENTLMKEWAKNYNVIEVPNIDYSNAHYQAKPSKAVEVLIRNY